MVDHVEDGRNCRKRAAEAQQSSDKAEVADGRISEQAFQVLLEHGEISAEQQRDDAGHAHQPEPFRRACQHRPEPREQENPRLHHGRRMQIGGNRCGRCHGVGQPEMEGKLRAFGQRAAKNENKCRQIEGMGADRGPGLDDLVQIVASRHMAEDEKSGQEAESAYAGHGQRHAGAVARAGVLVPIADQQKREDAGHFPEDRQQDDVAGQDHAEHRAHEGEEEGEKPRDWILGRHVITGVEHHEQADAGNEDCEDPGKPVQPQGEIQPELRQPFHIVFQRAAVADSRIKKDAADETEKGDAACNGGGAGGCAIARHESRQNGADKGQCDNKWKNGCKCHMQRWFFSGIGVYGGFPTTPIPQGS